jgi:hypothetical protein
VTHHPIRRILAVLAVLLVLLGVIADGASAAEPSATLRYYGDASSATGAALGQGACDVNGDDYDDVVVGAWFWDKAPNSNIGAAYVLFGSEDVHGGDLNTPGAQGAARIDGPSTANAFVGFAVGCLGDVNDDGIDDLGISYYIAERAYVVLGAEDFGSIDLSNLGERGYEVRGDPAGAANVGFSLSGVGDFNNDGIDDYTVAGVVADTNGRTNNGRVWVVAGKEDVVNVNLANSQPGEVLSVIDGAGSEDRLGSVAPAGDVNGDGFDDLVTGAYTSTPWGSGVAVPGQAWVVFGGSNPAIDLASLGTQGFAIRGPQRARDRLGISVSSAGDVNADGKDDLLIGGDGVYNAATGQRPGTAWVVFGAASTATVYTNPAVANSVYTCATESTPGVCTTGEAARGYSILGADSDPGTGSEGTGYSVSGIGDISGDGIPDFAIGAYGYDPVNPANTAATMSGAGAVWVVYGKASTTTQNLATLAPAEGYRIDGLVAGDRFGRQVAGLGDLDGNGAADFAGAGDFAQRPLAPGTPRSQAGEVALMLQGALNTETTIEVSTTDPVAVDETFDVTATTTRLAGGVAGVTSGTVTFSANGDAIAACTDVAVDPADGTADCVGLSFPSGGTYAVTAAYTGGATLGSSSSEPTEVEVTTPSGISGTVTQAGTGAPVAGGWVAVLRTADFSIAAGAATDASGNFSAEVPPGQYYVYGIDPSGRHVAGFHGGTNATVVTVTAGAQTDVDPVLASSRGSVTGTVTEQGTGTPVAGAWVLSLNAGGTAEALTTANASGQFTIADLKPGSHYLAYVDPTGAHAPEFFGDSPNVPEATTATVTAGATTTANGTPPAQTASATGSTLTGTVTESGTGVPLVGARVIALRASDYGFVRAVETDAGGHYSLALPAGEYKLAFVDGSGQHVPEWYDDTPYYELGSASSATAPGVADAALNHGTGSVSGTVTDDPSAAPVGGAWVLAIANDGLAGGAVTAADGTYTLAGLPVGTYRITFADPVGGRVQEYWDDHLTYEAANPVTVTAGSATSASAALRLPPS